MGCAIGLPIEDYAGCYPSILRVDRTSLVRLGISFAGLCRSSTGSAVGIAIGLAAQELLRAIVIASYFIIDLKGGE